MAVSLHTIYWCNVEYLVSHLTFCRFASSFVNRCSLFEIQILPRSSLKNSYQHPRPSLSHNKFGSISPVLFIALNFANNFRPTIGSKNKFASPPLFLYF
jgi:hypothetical protein